jgi:hypothetical protein
MEKTTIYSQLAKIQKELNVPKKQFNSFGKYYYRSTEDIVEEVKKHLGDLNLLITDEIVNIGERYYVRATVTLTDGVEKVEVSAFAREAGDKKGMDDAQVTGATSSYARKYALNGLFAIDDTKDADTQDNSKEAPKTIGSTNTTASSLESKRKQFYAVSHKQGLQADKIKEYVKTAYKVKSFNDMTYQQLNTAIERIRTLTDKEIKDINTFEDNMDDVSADDIQIGSEAL